MSDTHESRDERFFIPPPGPDAMEHFWTAAHEFLQAMRALVEAADTFVEEQRRPREPDDTRLHRIDIE